MANQRGLRGLLADRRGVAAFEFILVAAFLIFFLLLPIADVGVAALRYMQVKQAMRDLGALVQYNQAPDLTNVGSWTLSTTTVGTFSVAINTVFPTSENLINITVSCGPPPMPGQPPPQQHLTCTPSDLTTTSTPKYVWMGAFVQLNPIIIKTLTGGNIGYTERLQWPLRS
jgi:hypothetical protein